MNHPSDRTKLRRLLNRILSRKGLVGCAREYSVALHSRGKAVCVGADRYGQGGITAFEDVAALTCTDTRTAALMKDGTLRFAGGEPVDSALMNLSHVRALSCGPTHAAALLGNGRVVVGITCKDAARATAEWPVIFDVVCGKHLTVGLTPEGTVLAAGGTPRLRYILSTWSHIAGVFTDAEGDTVYGITAEGRLRATRPLPRRVESWRNLVFVAACGRHIWGITSLGQLLSTDPRARKLHEAGFIACAAASDHAVALTRDGLVLAVGDNRFGQCDTQRFGVLFESFDEFSADRRASNLRVAADEKTYQIRLTEANRYQKRLLCGKRFTACITADGRVLASAGFGASKHWSRVRALACGNAHLVALHEGGRVSADGNDTEGCTAVSAWQGIKSIAAGKYHTLGVTEDGRVLFCGRNDHGQGDVTDWSGIRKVFAADTYTVGLGYDGSIRVAGQPPFKPDEMYDTRRSPIDLAVTSTHMAVLYGDGTVRTTRLVPASQKPGDGEVWDTCGWVSVRAIAAGEGFTVGLCVGGRVVATGLNDCGQCDVTEWRSVVAVACGRSYTVGLTADGRVLSAGLLRTEQPESRTAYADVRRYRVSAETPDTDSWREVIALAAGPDHTVAMTREGMVLATGLDSDSQCTATTHFTLFRDARQLYGYGNYRKPADCGPLRMEEEEEGITHRPAEAPTLVPFTQFSAHLRADSAAILSRVTGSEDHLTVITEDGTPATYRFDTGEITRETHAPAVSALASLGSSTVYLSPDGTARLRDSSAPAEPLGTLPHKLGDSPFHRVTALASGHAHYAILMADGTVRSFGESDRGQCDTGDWKNIIAISAGDNHTAALRADGTVVATGVDRRDHAGRSRSATAHLPRANPCATEDWTGVTSVVCRGDVTLGLRHDGRVYAVGSNHFGQCDTEGWKGVVSVATSGQHTVALFGDGHVEAVGLNERGECRTESWSHIIQIAVLPELTMGLRSDGKLLAAGRHHEVLETLDTVRAMACFGSRRQTFVMSDGTVRIHNRGSEFFPEPLEGVRLFTPTPKYSVLNRYTANALPLSTAHRTLGSFAVGMAHTLALGQGGAILAEGAGDNGQCDLKAYATAVWVAAGSYHSAAILADGRIILSGRNTDGQCDARALNRELDTVGGSAEESRNGGVPTITEPDPADLPYAWKQVACGLNHTAALRSDGRVYAIGQNPDGRCDTRKWRNVTQIACGIRHTVAVTAEGTCVATGDNRYGQCDTTLWKNLTMVAAGEFHTVALRADGRVEAVGDDRKGQCRVEDLRDIVSVACLPEATLCVTAEGRVIIRGGSGQHDKAIEALREVVAIHTCEHRIAALTVDRRMILIP